MEEDFIKTADTGDLLLFRSKEFGPKLTRTFTKSNFGKISRSVGFLILTLTLWLVYLIIDHVAMVLKFEQEDSEVFFLDASYHNGVAI